MIRHEAKDERIRRRLHQEARKRPTEIIRIGLALRIHSGAAKRSQGLERDEAAGRRIDQLLELRRHRLEVVARLVQIPARGRPVRLVLVVRAREPISQDAGEARLAERGLAAHGPAEDVAVEGAADGGEEQRERRAHADDFCRRFDVLRYRRVAIVR